MLGQVDIGTLAQRRTNGWQMVGPTLAHRRPNIGMFMGVLVVKADPTLMKLGKDARFCDLWTQQIYVTEFKMYRVIQALKWGN